MFRIGLQKIEQLFADNNIKFCRCVLDAGFEGDNLPELLKEYLTFMGKCIYIHKIGEGNAKTTLFSQKDIIDEYKENLNRVCSENGYLMIGKGANGDYLCINLTSGNVGYVFSDNLWEENYDEFGDIYVELPYTLEEFLNEAFSDPKGYPVDGTDAERLILERCNSGDY